MAKKKTSSRKKKPTSTSANSPAKELSSFIRYGINVLGLVIMGVFVYWILFIVKNPLKPDTSLYNHMRINLIKGNLDYFKKYPAITMEEKWTRKLGMNYAVCKLYKEQTPEDAVILLPPVEERDKYNEGKDGKKMVNYLWSRAWVTYFLYPRKYCYANMPEDPLLQEVTHVAIFNYWGYDKLNYEMKQRTNFAALPITK